MRISGPVTVSALMVAGLVASGSAVDTAAHPASSATAEPRLAAAADATAATSDDEVGLVPAAPEAPRKLRAMAESPDGLPLFGGTVPLREISLPGGVGAFGIPELVLAAYRNAELALQSSDPNCGLSWHLLAGIGKIESNHAAGGRTDANGTTVGVIYGPSLDGTLPGNEVIKAGDGAYVRAIGPMQFLPGTWSRYASDGRGSGHPDPNNVFDAALAAGKYLCSGGLDLRDPSQELRAVLRYNDSLSYASEVLSWSNAYKTGGTPTQVSISPDLVPPGSMPEDSGTTDATGATPAVPTEPKSPQPQALPPTQLVINIPGLAPIPCGIFCTPPRPNSCDPAAVPPQPSIQDGIVAGIQQWAPGLLSTQAVTAQPAKPGEPALPANNPGAVPNGRQAATPAAVLQGPNVQQPAAPGAQQPPQPTSCVQPQAAQTPQLPTAPPNLLPGQPNPPQAATQPAPQPQTAVKTQEPGPTAPPAAAPPVAPPPPAIQLPFNITIPLPLGPGTTPQR